MNYKDTLCLPKTDFPMKADLPKREPLFLQKWESEKVYEALLQKNKGRPKFVLHDGPPYANGSIHFGHILNKVLKDIVVKYKNMAGFYSPYVPGWDCHGLPIELGAMKELEKSNHEKIRDPIFRRQACRDYAMRFVEIQSREFRRLGIFGQWEKPYLTLAAHYEATIAQEFIRLYLAGFVYRGKKPVYWCSSCKTALAEAEVEYDNHTSPSIYVSFQLKNESLLTLPRQGDVSKGVFFVIWTTTPWTLPANLALAVGGDYPYAALQCGEKIFVVAKNLKDAFLKAIGFEGEALILKTWKGEELARLKLVCSHPFMDRDSPVLLGSHVTLESGTGIVHIAPGHGQEDYEMGQQHHLEILCPVDEAGRFAKGALSDTCFEEVKAWEGVPVLKANSPIIDFLHQHHFLLNKPGDQITHSYPHCWRCKKPVFFRATKQWFISLEHQDLRKRALRVINGDVKWIPSWGRDRIHGMIESRPDWCLSRQRIWGVPIVIHYCKKCRTPFLNEKVGAHMVTLFQEAGADAWWNEKAILMPKDTQCDCGSKEFERETSILDVWFDSGVSFAAVLEKNASLAFPADLYLEGSDQHRGWFHSSLLASLATRAKPPYKTVLTHGFVVDGEGKKYSKSAKNYLPPEKLISQLGVELIRLWVACEDYRNDIRMSEEIIKVLAEVYRKMRNTCRFLLGNLYDFNPASDLVPFEKRTELDAYSLHLLSRVVKTVEDAYENYEFHSVHHTLNKFFTVDLSAKYLDILKDRLYCDLASGYLRRSAQSTLHDILLHVIPLMAPILSFTAEEIWQFIPFKNTLPSSVFLAEWPTLPEQWLNPNLETKWQRIWAYRDEILKALEISRQKKEIGHGLDAKVCLSAEGEALAFLERYQKDWTQVCIVSQVEIKSKLKETHFVSSVIPTLKISVFPADGKKCERCWNYSVQVGKNKTHPVLCHRCVDAIPS